MYKKILNKILSQITSFNMNKSVVFPDTRQEDYHHFDLGLFEKDGESFSLSGSLYCPFEYNFQSNEENIAQATKNYVSWAIQVGLIPDHHLAKEKLEKGDFARFAALTSVTFDMQEYTPAHTDGMTTSDKIKYIQSHHTVPLSVDSATREAKYLTFLFLHDDWAERQVKPQLVKRVNDLIGNALEFTQKPVFSKVEFYNLISRKEGEVASDEKDYVLIQGFINAASELRKIYGHGFFELNGSNSGVVGYPEFLASVKQYLEATNEESINREGQRELLTEPVFNQKRLYTSAVYTVYLAAVLEGGVQIPLSILPSSSEDQLRVNFSRLICRFNGLISAHREKDKSNWGNNDLNFIKRSRDSEGNPISLEGALGVILRHISVELRDSEQILEKIVAELPYLIYTCVIIQWGIGSIPAQLCSERYSEHRADGPYIPKDQKQFIGSDFWRFMTPK